MSCHRHLLRPCVKLLAASCCLCLLFGLAPAAFADLLPEFAFIAAGANIGTDPDFGDYSLNVTAFYIGRHEVTHSLWDEVRAWATVNGYEDLAQGYGKNHDHPVNSISWYDAIKWCNARSEKEGRAPCYFISSARTTIYRTGQAEIDDSCVDWGADGYRLPTTTEWEYAARGGLSGRRFPWGDTISHSQANYNSSDLFAYDVSPTRGHHPDYLAGGAPYTNPVGSFAANSYGLHDLVGNTFEWNWNWHPDYEGSFRVLRGGGWGNHAEHARVGFEYWYYPGDDSYGIGFRLCVAASPTPSSVDWEAATQDRDEAAGTVEMVALLSQPLDVAVTIPFTVSGTATLGLDYTMAESPLLIPAGQTHAILELTILDDALPEPDETVIVTIGEPINALRGAILQHTLTIRDNDGQLGLSLSLAAAAISEDGGTTVATVTRNTDTGAELVVDLTSSDTTEAVVPATVTIAAGSSTATFAVNAVDDEDFDGDILVTITATAPDHADGTATILILDDEQAENLVYTFTVRGTQYGDGVAPQAGNGYLVIDLRDHQASAVVRWQDGSGDRIDFPGWYTADIGASNIWVLHVSDVEAVPVAIGEYHYGHMFGTMHPSEVPLGGGVTGPAVVSFAGPWRGGAPFGQPTLVEMGDMSARFDYARTKQENTSNTPFEVLLVELAADAGFQLPEFNRQAEADAAITAALEGQGIACYSLNWSGVNAGENAVQSFSYPGYLLLDLSTGEMQALRAWRQGTQWYYTIETWSTAESFAYPLTVAGSTYTFLGGRDGILRAGFAHPEDYRFRFMYGANRTVKIGLPSNEPQTLPLSLSGNLWGHVNGTYTQSTITCAINGAMTLTINQGSMTLDQAMLHVEGTLPSFTKVE